MDPEPTIRFASRTNMRRAVYSIIRRLLVQRLVQQQQRRARAAQGSDANNAPPRLNKSQRRQALRQAHALENILYRRACSLEEYQDPLTLEQRVFVVGRAVYVTSRRREMEGQQGQTMRERVANAMSNYARGLEDETSRSMRREPSSQAAAALSDPPSHPGRGS